MTGRNHLHECSMSNPMSTPRAASYAMLVLAPALLLAACGGNGDSATSSQSSPASQAASDRPVTDSVHVDAAIEKNPCELAPAEMVAGLFGVPAADLERESSMSSACVYSWENDDETERLDVKRSEEHTSELKSLMRNSYAVFCL